MYLDNLVKEAGKQLKGNIRGGVDSAFDGAKAGVDKLMSGEMPIPDFNLSIPNPFNRLPGYPPHPPWPTAPTIPGIPKFNLTLDVPRILPEAIKGLFKVQHSIWYPGDGYMIWAMACFIILIGLAIFWARKWPDRRVPDTRALVVFLLNPARHQAAAAAAEDGGGHGGASNESVARPPGTSQPVASTSKSSTSTPAHFKPKDASTPKAGPSSAK